VQVGGRTAIQETKDGPVGGDREVRLPQGFGFYLPMRNASSRSSLAGAGHRGSAEALTAEATRAALRSPADRYRRCRAPGSLVSAVVHPIEVARICDGSRERLSRIDARAAVAPAGGAPEETFVTVWSARG
jgi:hypothetical protein